MIPPIHCTKSRRPLAKTGTRLKRAVIALVLGAMLSGCSTTHLNTKVLTTVEAKAMTEAMGARGKILLLSSPELDRNKAVLLLLHGATDDPTEMMDIVHRWSGEYNVALYVYNQHRPIRKLASEFASEMRLLRDRMENLGASGDPVQNLTVVTYSYSAAVFRKAVISSEDRTLFAGASLIQLVPTPGGSYLARGMKYRLAAMLICLVSKPSATENPYGRIASELWGAEGDRKFYETIDCERMQTVLVEGDPHSLAGVRDEEVRRRYRNGIGPNVVVIPKSSGVTHEYLPTQPIGLLYLKHLLGSDTEEAADRNRIVWMGR